MTVRLGAGFRGTFVKRPGDIEAASNAGIHLTGL